VANSQVLVPLWSSRLWALWARTMVSELIRRTKELTEVSEAQIAARDAGGGWPALMQFQIERARAMLLAGAPLALKLPGRIGLEIRMTVQGGLCILDKLERHRGDAFRHRPVLRPFDWPMMLARALAM